MTDAEINKAISEWCGYTNVDIYEHGGFGIPPGETKPPRVRLPNYVEDLNPCHSFELLLDGPNGSLALFDKYADTLRDLFGRSIRATARQRCEALLRTIGKWKE